MALDDSTVSELKKHPKGQITCQGSQMMQATMGRFSIDNGATMKHTMARKQNGVVLGVPDCNGSVEIDVAADGLEQPWYTLVQSGTEVAFQYEIPTLNVEITGVLKSIDTELPMDQAVKLTVSWVGRAGKGTSF